MERRTRMVPLPRVSSLADALLDEMEARGCAFFFEQASPNTGLMRDHSPANGKPVSHVASIAATGFGLSALCIAHKRSYLKPSDCEARVEKTLDFIVNRCPHLHGFLYHFVDMEAATRAYDSEVSSIDTALLLCGVLHCRGYFTGNRNIEKLATQFYERIDWNWMRNGGDTLSMGWMPENGFLKARWNIYAELLAMYLMAIGSPTHPLPPSSWEAIARPVFHYGGISYISNDAPLFIHQYAHAWVDFRGQRDRHTNYFINSIKATRAHQMWCLVEGRNFSWMDQDLWGITASDSREGYRVWGGPPPMGRIDGTVVPSAAAGSLVFLPEECAHVLTIMRDRYKPSWTRYGFVDAFQPRASWYAPEILGIDQGISVLMAENLRTGSVWAYFLRNREITRALGLVGFRLDPRADEAVL